MSAIALPLHTDKHDPTPKAHPDEKNYEAILISKDPPLASNEGPIWPGLKALLKVLEASAELFGPVKLAMEGLNGCVRIYEVWACVTSVITTYQMLQFRKLPKSVKNMTYCAQILMSY
jgi:hypothetical protein